MSKIKLSQQIVHRIVKKRNVLAALNNSWSLRQLVQLIVLWNETKQIYEGMGVYGTWYNPELVFFSISNTSFNYSCTCYDCDSTSACIHVGIVLNRLLQVQDDFDTIYIEDCNRLEQDIVRWENHYGKTQCLHDEVKRIEELKKIQWMNQQIEKSDWLLNNKKKELLPSAPLNQKRGTVTLELVFLVPKERYLKQDGILYLLNLKVKETRAYIVRHVNDFIHRIMQESYYEYGKQLAFHHRLDSFDENGQKIIQMLIKMTKLGLRFTYDYRSVCIEKQHLDLLYDTLLQTDGLNHNLELDKKQLKAEIQIHSVEVADVTYYRVKTKKKSLISTAHHRYQIKDLKLIRYSSENSTQIMDVLNFLNEERYFSLNQLKEFGELYLDPIQKELKLNGFDAANLIRKKESFTFYADINDAQQLTLLTVVKNNEKEHYLFDEQWKDKSFSVIKMEHLIKLTADMIDAATKEARFYTEHVFETVQDVLPALNEHGQVFISDRLKRFTSIRSVTLSAGVRVEAGLLHVNFSTDGLDSGEIQQMLNAYRRKKRFYLLKDGTTVDLANSEGLEEFERLNRQLHLEDVQMKNGEYLMDTSMALRFESMDNQFENIQLQRDETFKKLIHEYRNDSYEALDEKYDSVLRDYQKAGVHWLKKLEKMNFNGILADDMGLGKTLQVIALLDGEKKDNRYSLVVCPSSLLYNWENEIHKFTDTLSCQVIGGSAARRKEAISKIEQYDVNVITYDALKRDIDLFEGKEFYYVILDEAQYIKNQKTKNASSVKKLQSAHRLALTGTPIENSLAELWSIFDFLMPKFLFNYHYFANAYEKPIVSKKDEEISAELKKLVEPFILRRTKKEVLKELPEKVETLYTIDFEEHEWKLYLANLAKVNKDLQKQFQMESMDRFQILAMLTRLRQICCDPNIVFDDYPNQGSKMSACLELVETLAASGKKMLLFSSFTTVLDSLKDKLSERGIASYTLQGSTSKEERMRLVERFQMDDTPVFLISLKAGGTGLNLTAAEAVIHYDPWWNLSAQNQATDRAYRIGQKNMVSVYSLIMKGSIEEKIVKLQQEKKNLADVFVEDSHGSITKMSQEEIFDLFEMPEK